ncbi:magnesium protoporphyrin IX methyltransferase [Citromicrobium bathyomarinum]|uniref:magnesium protoporphyrin IX methyltransferase n=1 Tax=Citromicrobium bathyomarinum TaxID=72174 RepID=UPI003159B904
MASQAIQQGGATPYDLNRDRLATYFDSTAQKAWIDLTSDAPVSGIRATVRAGRDAMRQTLLSWLPQDLRRTRVLDAGCGTGAFSVEAAYRGAEVTGVDVAAGLVEVARKREPSFIGHGRIAWRSGDMLDPALGEFAHVVAMDSLIHYREADLVAALAQLGERTSHSMLFTFVPRTPLLFAMYQAGKLFPRSDRSPRLVPLGEDRLCARLAGDLPDWRVARSERVSSGFYISHAIELVRR